MKTLDTLRYAGHALGAARLRLQLLMLAVAIGVFAVVVLTALGEGTRRYVLGQFETLGSDLLIVLPGRYETTGGPPPMLGMTPRDLTLGDAQALLRSPAVQAVAPLVLGSAEVSYRARAREINMLGSTHLLREVRRLPLGEGRFLPDGDLERAQPVCVLGATVREELFGEGLALGRRIRVADRQCRVIGVLASEGQAFDVDWNDMVIMPVAYAQLVFDTASLFRVLVMTSGRGDIDQARADIERIIRARHEGENDVTVISQDAVLSTFDNILGALTAGVAGIAAISLSVAGILIMNVMLVSVSQRRGEIGLLKALGAPRRTILRLFLTEATLLAGGGALCGLLLGAGGVLVMAELYPALAAPPPAWAIGASVLVSVGAGLLFGLLPARRAAALDPVEALRS